MKLLFGQNLSFKLCRRLGDLFPGSSQARLLGLERQDDRAIWDYAADDSFVLVTKDADFAEMAALFGPPKVIWVRSGNRPSSEDEEMLRRRCDAIMAFGQDADAACLEVY